MYFSVHFPGFVDYAEKWCFRVADTNVFQYVAVDVRVMNVTAAGNRRLAFCPDIIRIPDVLVETQHVRQVSTKLDEHVAGDCHRYSVVVIRKLDDQQIVRQPRLTTLILVYGIDETAHTSVVTGRKHYFA